jgi:hypothetical protein
MRLGYSYRISWGGSPIFFKFNPDLPIGSSAFITNTNPAPGAKLQLSDERWYAYVGFKTSMLLNRNPQVNEQVAVYGALAGAGVDIIPEHLRLEANGGYFDRGKNEAVDVSASRWLYGASAQVVLHQDPGRLVDRLRALPERDREHRPPLPQGELPGRFLVADLARAHHDPADAQGPVEGRLDAHAVGSDLVRLSSITRASASISWCATSPSSRIRSRSPR